MYQIDKDVPNSNADDVQEREFIGNFPSVHAALEFLRGFKYDNLFRYTVSEWADDEEYLGYLRADEWVEEMEGIPS